MARKRLVNLWISSPIDWWSGMIDLSTYKAGDFAVEYEEPGAFEKRVSDLLSAAQNLARKHGWEGDTIQGPYLSAIPHEDGHAEIVLAWKQGNNGTTFIASEALLTARGYTSELPYQAEF